MTATRSLALALLLVSAPALAQSPAPRDPIAAEALFERGKLLMDQGRTPEACSAFAESQRLDPAGGTLLRLALCHEAEGKLASAWLEFGEVVRVSKEGSGDAAKLQERVRLAREHLAAVEPRVPKLAIRVGPAARVDGLRVTANGLPRSEATWGVALPVDPGDVAVVASAPGRQESRVTVHVGEGEQTNVDLLPLPLAPATLRLLAPALPPAPSHGSLLRPLGIGLGLAGLASLGVGAYFGARAISKWNDSNVACPGTSCTNPSGVTLANDAKSSARIADVTLAAGVVALAAGVVLYLAGAPAPDTRGAADTVMLRF
ncbi:MAG: hypothetical protein ABSE49_21805 [Polyangiaceae bacterium]|jgi:hypothetical protein